MDQIKVAIVEDNRLAAMGLRMLLQDIIPYAELCIFRSLEELAVAQPESFMHYFVSSSIYFQHTAYFQQRSHRSIVLVQGDGFPRLPGLLTLNVCQDEAALTKDVLRLRHLGHPAMPACSHPAPRSTGKALLTPREAEVAVLLAKGYINKEIADRLCISLTTVITHRKNIMEKLRARSLAAVIIHVVMQRLVAIEELGES